MKNKFIARAPGMIILLVISAGCQDSRTTVPVAPAVRGDQITIMAHCIVSFYPDGAAEYISEQQHSIRLVSGDIGITAREPGGTFRWQIVGGSYESSPPEAAVGSAPVAVIDRDIVLAILTAFRASAGYYTAESGQRQDKTRIDGKWYQPIELDDIAVGAVRITLLQSPDDGAIDLVRIHNDTNGAVTTAGAYNLSLLEDAGTFVPTKIDIFRRTASADADRKILQVHYRSFSVP